MVIDQMDRVAHPAPLDQLRARRLGAATGIDPGVGAAEQRVLPVDGLTVLFHRMKDRERGVFVTRILGKRRRPHGGAIV